MNFYYLAIFGKLAQLINNMFSVILKNPCEFGQRLSQFEKIYSFKEVSIFNLIYTLSFGAYWRDDCRKFNRHLVGPCSEFPEST